MQKEVEAKNCRVRIEDRNSLPNEWAFHGLINENDNSEFIEFDNLPEPIEINTIEDFDALLEVDNLDGELEEILIGVGDDKFKHLFVYNNGRIFILSCLRYVWSSKMTVLLLSKVEQLNRLIDVFKNYTAGIMKVITLLKPEQLGKYLGDMVPIRGDLSVFDIIHNNITSQSWFSSLIITSFENLY
jgi:hypothetical protein